MRVRALFLCLFVVVASARAQAPSPTIAPLPTVSGSMAGTIAGTFSVSDSGSATYDMPLSVPPGTAGMAPALSLNYDSARGVGLMGPGWTLSGLSAITRCPRTIAQDGMIKPVSFDSLDRFCLDGQRLVAVVGAYGEDLAEYRTESESFAKIVSRGQAGVGPESFTVYQKNGRILEYGATPDARLTSSGQAGILTWQLSRVADRLGNNYSIVYSSDPSIGESKPLRIDYTSNAQAGLAAYNSVRFVYDPVANPSSGFIGGVRFTSNFRLRTVQMFTGDSKAWEYRITYNIPEPVALETRLARVQECDGAGECLPSTILYWGPHNGDSANFTQSSVLADLSPQQGFSSAGQYEVASGDWDGDGKSDIARAYSGGQRFYVSRSGGFTFRADLPFPNWVGTPLGRRFRYGPMYTGDFNGDGKTDVAVLYEGLLSSCGNAQICLPFWGLNFYLASNSGFSYTAQLGLYTSAMPNPTGQPYYSTRNPILIADWNGDGRADLGYVADGGVRFWTLNAGTLVPLGGSDASTLADFSPGQGYNSTTELPILTGDWNGDGISDIARVHNSGTRFYVGTGAGFALYQDLPDFGSQQGFPTALARPYVTGDWNSDGKTDIARVRAGDMRFYVSTGSGFTLLNTLADFSPAQGFTDGNVFPVLTMDFNGDGTTDIGRIQNNDTRFYTIKSGTFSAPIAVSQFSVIAGGFTDADTYPLFLGDWNGDSFADLARVTSSGVTFLNRTASTANVMSNIIDGFGKRIQISYSLLTNSSVYTKGSGSAYPTTDIQQPFTVVSNVAMSNGLGGFAWNFYRYTGLRADLNGRGMSGFEKIQVDDYDTGIRSTTYFRQDHPFKGLARLKEQRLSNGTLIGRKQDTWTSQSSSAGTYLVQASQSIDETFEFDGTLVKSSVVDRTFDAFGNPIGVVTTLSDGSRESTVNTFHNDLERWLVGQLTSSVVTKEVGDQSSAPIIRGTSFTYQTASGLLLNEKVEPGLYDFEVTKSYTYDVFGNQVSVSISSQSGEVRSSGTEYDTLGRFPVRSSNALGHVETREFDVRHGLATRLTGPNGVTSHWSYDGFGRVVLETSPTGALKRTLHLTPPVDAPSGTIYIMRTDRSGQPPEIQYYDTLSREVRRETSGFDGRRVFIDKAYDVRGHLTNISEPYFEGDVPLWTVSEFDVIGRPTRVTAPGNRQTVMAHARLTSTVTNALGQVATQTVDVHGRTISMRDNLGNVLTYQYDAVGNPLRITDPAGNVTVLEYDRRGKKTRLLEPDSGETTFSYNAFGELLSQTDARGVTQRLVYDALGRVVSRETPGGVERWRYDVSPHGVGKIGQVVGLDGYTETFTYDSFGRVIQQARLVSGTNYTVRQHFDVNGRIDLLTYPSGFAVRHVYTANGFLSEVRNAVSGASYWRADANDARGNITEQTLGNGLEVQKTYDADTGFLERIQTGTVQDLRFEFDSLGNLRRRVDGRISVGESFSYDGLNRLVSSHVDGRQPVTISYDSLGNILSRSDVGAYSYGAQGAGPHAVTSIAGPRAATYVYDAAGNRIGGTRGSVEYDAAGRPTRIVDGITELRFVLDPSGDRVEQRIFRRGAQVEQKVYFGAIFERVNENSISHDVHYIRGGDEVRVVVTVSRGIGVSHGMVPAVASESLVRTFFSGELGDGREVRRGFGGSKTRTVVRYLLSDHLGSIQTITSETGAIVEVVSYDSWGQRRNPVSWTPVDAAIRSEVDRGFTGHEQLEDVQLIHMNGRVYDPSIGRFLSPDPHVQSPYDLQSHNRYSYVNNNPLSFTDPDGFFLRGLFRSIGRLLRRVLPIAMTVAVGYFTGLFLMSPTTWLNSALLCSTSLSTYSGALISGISAAGGGFASTITGTLMNGGNLRDGLRAGVRGLPLSALSGALANGIGDAFGGGPLGLRAVAHGVSGGTTSVLGGGKFGPGFASGVAATFGARGDPVQAIIAGGTGAAIAGGRFEDGALRSAFQYLYNDLVHEYTASARGLHQRLVVVDDAGRRIFGMSFGFDGRSDGSPYVGEFWDSIFSGGPSRNGSGYGAVYEDFRGPGTGIANRLFTSREEDLRIIAYLQSRIGDVGPYNVAGYNCRDFTSNEFHKIYNEIWAARFDLRFGNGRYLSREPHFSP